jgi:hypothetical protein
MPKSINKNKNIVIVKNTINVIPKKRVKPRIKRVPKKKQEGFLTGNQLYYRPDASRGISGSYSFSSPYNPVNPAPVYYGTDIQNSEIKRLENKNNNVLQQLTDLTNKSYTESVSVSGVYDAPPPPLLLNNVPVVVPIEKAVFPRIRGVRTGTKRGTYYKAPTLVEIESDKEASTDPGLENMRNYKPKIPPRPSFLKFPKN